MAASVPSGKALPAGFAASYLKVMVDLIGRHGADAVLRRSGLEAWIGRPESSLADETLDFAQAAAWLNGLEETLGARGARGLGRRMGSAAFERVLRPVGAVAAMRDPGFQAFPVDRRLRAGMYGLARTFGAMTSTAVTTREEQGAIILRLEACPDCWGRTAPPSACAPMLGLLSAAAAWIAPEAETHVEETNCRAQGAPACEFRLRWEDGG
jgi:hypothetical protein